MFKRSKSLAVSVFLAIWALPAICADVKTGSAKPTRAETAHGEAVLWKEPADIGSRNLYYGIGGENDQPHGPFTFVEEDLDGTNPKFIVLDRDKVKWTVKLGMEARPETAASRLVWAVGYSTNEDYFLQDIQIDGFPAKVKRGSKQIGPNGVLHAVRLKRHLSDEKKVANWKWNDEPFAGTRELNGLKVMMALVNNWDLKDVNNEIYSKKGTPEEIYMVSDLGASFGTTGISFPFHRSKGDLKAYSQSKFITKISNDFVDFRTPSRPALIYVFNLPAYLRRSRLDGIGHHIPRADARWMGKWLSSLSTDQIHDAFRSAGYTQAQIEAFTKVVQARVTELNQL